MQAQTIHFNVSGREMTLTDVHSTYLAAVAGMDYAAQPLAALMRQIPPAATCLDIGANIGVTALIMAARSPEDRVFAFEPVRQNAEFLRQNLRENAIANCTVFETALGDVSGTVQMNVDGPWSLIGAGNHTVPMVTLDAWYAANLEGVRIDLIKIDAEGYEPNVLAGAAAVIKRWHPVILMEFNSWTLLLQGYNPLAFAGSLLRSFDVTSKGGKPLTDARLMVHDIMKVSGCVDDLIMRARHDAVVAPASVARFGDVARELAAVYASKSWRITAPLRFIRKAFRRSS